MGVTRGAFEAQIEHDQRGVLQVFCPKQEQWTVVRTSFSVKGIHQTVFRNQLLGVVGE